MARTITALLVALAAIAGVAVAADDSNIGSRHAVDLKKVRGTKRCHVYFGNKQGCPYTSRQQDNWLKQQAALAKDMLAIPLGKKVLK